MCMIKEVKEELFYSQRTMGKMGQEVYEPVYENGNFNTHACPWEYEKKFLRQRNGRKIFITIAMSIMVYFRMKI